jgi:hypothetical protein
MRRDDGPAPGFRLGEHVHEVGVGDAEQRVDSLGLEEVENAFVHGYAHEYSFYW